MSTQAHPAAESSRAAASRAAAALRTETGLARVALGVAALHVVDDNFLQPQPGTSAGDHLVGGLVQTAFFVGLAWGYPRMRPGLRGTMAIFVGLFMIVMGAGEAGHYTREDGPSGDDYTGLLTIPAGLLLAGVGLVTLWKSRKGGSPVRRYARRAGLTLALLIGLLLVLYPLGESYVVTHSARAYVPTPELGAAFEEVAFTTSDGLRLEGSYVPSKNGAAVISFPGHLFGWQGARDIAAAIQYLKTRPEVDDERIGGLGLSVGGEMMLEEAAGNDELKAVVSEGAGVRSIREAVHHDGVERAVLSWASGIATVGTAVWTSNLPPRSLTDLSAELTQPVLFIHATPGQGGEKLTEQYYEAARGPKELWEAPGKHIGAIDAAPAEYERRVVGFFDRTLLNQAR